MFRGVEEREREKEKYFLGERKGVGILDSYIEF